MNYDELLADVESRLRGTSQGETMTPTDPQLGEHDPWALIGYLRGTLMSEGAITVEAWNKAAQYAQGVVA